jgi:hypothetical protein
MFSSFLDSNNKLLVNRLARAQAAILALSLSTKEEYLAQITSIVNGVINNGYAMQSLIKIAPATPGVVGDPVSNLLTLNDDAADIAAEIDRLEDNASTLFNLSAASRNSICQQIRQAIYQSTSKTYIEQFINTTQIDSSSSANVDMNAGVAQLPLTSETVLTPTLSVGVNSIGSTTDNISDLSTSSTENLFTWNGSLLEIIVTFPAPTIVNRLNLSPDTYVGYELTTFTGSPDGTKFEDILRDLGNGSIVLDASAGKYSGATVIDFPPLSVSKMRLILQNLTAGDTIGLRAISFTQRVYQASGTVITKPQTLPTGQVSFQTTQQIFDPYVSITHQISGDSVNYTTVQPGEITLPAQWWYRALLNRSSQAFTQAAPVAATTADPNYSTGFTLVSSSSVPLDATTLERTLVFSNVTAAIPLTETPLPGTLQVSQGTQYLNGNQFSLDAQNNLTINNPTGLMTVTYQTSAQGSQNIASLQNFYTPLLQSVQFGK